PPSSRPPPLLFRLTLPVITLPRQPGIPGASPLPIHTKPVVPVMLTPAPIVVLHTVTTLAAVAVTEPAIVELSIDRSPPFATVPEPVTLAWYRHATPFGPTVTSPVTTPVIGASHTWPESLTTYSGPNPTAVLWNAPGVVGKLEPVDRVFPMTYTSPWL